jgi:acylphosphatase
VAEELDLSGWVANTTDPSRVTALIQGSPEAVGLLVRLAFEGPAGADVVEARAQRVSAVSLGGFTIRHDLGGAADGVG